MADGKERRCAGFIQGAALRAGNHHSLRPRVYHLQVELSRLSGDDGRARGKHIPHDNPETGSTVVVAVAGEDTRVRLIGVDTPETVHPRS